MMIGGHKNLSIDVVLVSKPILVRLPERLGAGRTRNAQQNVPYAWIACPRFNGRIHPAPTKSFQRREAAREIGRVRNITKVFFSEPMHAGRWLSGFVCLGSFVLTTRLW